jgi:putative SOS response-associated peptidase YedK
MCARAKLALGFSETKLQLRFDDRAAAPNLSASWNIAPTDPMLTAMLVEGRRVPALMRWGLIPFWAKDKKIGFSTINARSDGVETKPAFRDAWRAGRRCLIVTDGFYEWRKSDKQPFAIARGAGKLTVMAGLWEVWTDRASGERIKSCAVITTDASSLLAPLHERMPVILGEEDWPAWLGEVSVGQAVLRAMLRPYRSADLEFWPVGKAVGNVRNNGPELAQPIACDTAQ